MGFNRRAQIRERQAALRAEEEQRRREQGRDVAQAQKLVAVWNSRAARKARPSFYPTIETALLAGAPWLAFMCPACHEVGEVDLRTLDRHPAMSISGLIPSLSCRWCCSNPPFAKLLELTHGSSGEWATAHERMPLILSSKDYLRWLGDEADPRDLMRPFPAEPMRMWPISTRVNKPENDDPSILDKIQLATEAA